MGKAKQDIRPWMTWAGGAAAIMAVVAIWMQETERPPATELDAAPVVAASITAKGLSALNGAYASDVRTSDSTTHCAYREVESRHVVRCGLSYGGDYLAQVGFWEIEPNGDAFSIYAMNGKALTALEKMHRPEALSARAYPGVFKSGAGRAPLDIAKARKIIDAE